MYLKIKRRNERVLLLLLCSFIFLGKVNAQNGEDNFFQIIEQLIEQSENEEFNYDTYFEHFVELDKHPLNLNKATFLDLKESQLFSEVQMNSLLSHIEKNGKLISYYELQAIPNFDVPFVRRIKPFVKIKGNIDDLSLNFGKLISKGTYQFFLRYQQKTPKSKAYLNNMYLGNPSKIYMRYKYSYGNKFSYGITAEKDAGEPMFMHKNTVGFDFYSFHFFWRKSARWRAIAIGDYQINMGQGLIMWLGFGFNKSVNSAMIKKQSSILKPYTSVNENLFLRGVASTLQWNKIQVTPFVSIKKVDANINYLDTLEQEIALNTLQSSGYHRTPSEMNAKDAIIESKTGLNVQYLERDKHFGLNYLLSHFSKRLAFNEKLYNKYQFSGKTLQNISIDYHVLLKSLHLFGEEALSISKDNISYAFLNGLMFNPSKYADVSIAHRFYAPQYQTVNYTNAFGESSKPNNEQGVYIGARLKPFKKITISTYMDFYHFPWLKYRADKPSSGQDVLFNIKYKPNRTFELYCTYKWEQKEENTKISLDKNDRLYIDENNKSYIINYFGEETIQSDEIKNPFLTYSDKFSKSHITAVNFITLNILQRIRFHSKISINKKWTLDSRAEYSFFHDKINKRQEGFMIYQNIKYSSFLYPIAFSARIALFDVSHYRARIYTYENDVLYQFNVPAFYKRGLRAYFNMQYKIHKNIQIWFRIANTYYFNEEDIGTGLEEVQNNNIVEFKTQVRLKF